MDEYKKLKNLIDEQKEGNDYLNSLNLHICNNDHENVIIISKKFGKRVLFLTGRNAMRNLGFVRKYLDLFKKNGLEVTHFDNISSNPTLKEMEECVELAKNFKPDFIFALGGGSTIDTAKAISLGLFGKIWDFVNKKSEIVDSIPIVASITTLGTSSQVTPYAVITNTDTAEKKTVKSLRILPKLSIADIDIIKHAPKSIVSSAGFDMLCHCIEVYTRKECSEIADIYLKEAFRLIGNNLIPSFKEDNPDYILNMAYADIYAGIALSLIGTHVPHAISHPLSARFPEIKHGESLAYVMPETCKLQIEKGDDQTKERFKEISLMIGGDEDFNKTLQSFISNLDLKKNFRKFNKNEIDMITKDTLSYRKSSVERSPVHFTEEDIKHIITKSLE
ncbi:iron-containing alcohol dehydrogenase [Nanoarchaeota archaeon]